MLRGASEKSCKTFLICFVSAPITGSVGHWQPPAACRGTQRASMHTSAHTPFAHITVLTWDPTLNHLLTYWQPLPKHDISVDRPHTVHQRSGPVAQIPIALGFSRGSRASGHLSTSMSTASSTCVCACALSLWEGDSRVQMECGQGGPRHCDS